jgi:hypothetical protein
MSDALKEGFQPGARPICVFCNAPWTDEMVKLEFDVSCYDSGCSAAASLDIVCENCHRLIYTKREYG